MLAHYKNIILNELLKMAHTRQYLFNFGSATFKDVYFTQRQLMLYTSLLFVVGILGLVLGPKVTKLEDAVEVELIDIAVLVEVEDVENELYELVGILIY